MATDFEDVTDSFHALDITREAAQSNTQEPSPSTHDLLASFQDGVDKLAEATKIITLQAQNIKSAVKDAVPGTLPMTEICSLHRSTKKVIGATNKLIRTTNALKEATEGSVVVHLRSLSNQSTKTLRERQLSVEELFSHFDKQIRSIIREVMRTSKHEHVLWQVAEKCYMQATSHSGSLHADKYFNSLEEDNPGPPSGHDTENQGYYEDEDQLSVHRDQAHSIEKLSWVDFWITVLSNSPHGPTLFYPPAGSNSQSLKFEDVPKYLFRTFDFGSSGTNNENEIASVASTVGPSGCSRIDLLSLERSEAAEQLRMHLEKGCFDRHQNDNLMSWTNSLLYAIQYAVWRSKYRQSRAIHICVVDTERFPQGQFARDIWLFDAIQSKTLPQGPPQKFFHFRRTHEKFYNGEYLSQGTVNLVNRSCIASLQSLKEAGLYELYPEYEDVKGMEEWTRRALKLRELWSETQGTTKRDIRLALKIARECFGQWEAFDIASILLTFRNRRISRSVSLDNPNLSEELRPRWADIPVDVNRHWEAAEAARFHKRSSPIDTCPTPGQDEQALREVFSET